MAEKLSNDPVLNKIYKEAEAKLTGKMCYTIEWRDEDLPLENEEGDAMDKLVQEYLDNTQRRPGILEYIEKPWENAPPQLDEAPPVHKESVLVFPDTAGFCQGILDNAPEGRLSEIQVVQDCLADMSQEEVKSYIDKGWDLVIFGCGLEMPRSNAIKDIIEHQDRVTRLYFDILKVLSRNEEAVKKIAVLTRGCFSEDPDLHNNIGLGVVTSGTLYGMTNTARMELPSIAIHYIETEYCLADQRWRLRNAPLLPRLASEVFRTATFGHCSAQILHEGRFVLRSVLSTDYEVANQQFLLPTRGIIAITGGNGALGLVFGEWLLEKAAQQNVGGFEIKFLSRSAKVNDQNMPAWELIQKKANALKVKVEQTKCDFSDREACHRFVANCTPNLYGLIHSAGVLQDKMLMTLTWDTFDTVWDAKSRAAMYLHEALELHDNPNLTFFWMFSSTAVYGNPGQMNYSASNSYLDALCRHRRATGRVATAIQWGAWGEVGMAANLPPEIQKAMYEGPQIPFSTKDGLKGLEAGLRAGVPLVCCCKWNPLVMFKAMQGCDTPSSCYTRNLFSEFCPTSGAPSWDRFHLYTMYRIMREHHCEQNPRRLVYERYIDPVLDDELDSSWW